MTTSILTFLSLCLILVIGCGENSTTFRGKSSLGKEEIRGKILSIDKNNSLIRAEILGCGESLFKDWGEFSGFVKSFTVQPGDLNLLSNKFMFRATIRQTFTPSEGTGYLLVNVWPDDRSERIRVNNVNRLLRRDTLSMGESMIKSVGDTLPPFALYDQDGNTLTTDYFDGSVTVLNFIFTPCSIAEMCPVSTMRMKKL